MSDLHLTPLDPFEPVRRRPTMYQPEDKSDPLAFATQIAYDALVLGCEDVRILRRQSWMVIASTHDWLGPDVVALFGSLASFPESATNDIRSESILSAFAQCIVLKNGASHVSVIKGGRELSADSFCKWGVRANEAALAYIL